MLFKKIKELITQNENIKKIELIDLKNANSEHTKGRSTGAIETINNLNEKLKKVLKKEKESAFIVLNSLKETLDEIENEFLKIEAIWLKTERNLSFDYGKISITKIWYEIFLNDLYDILNSVVFGE